MNVACCCWQVALLRGGDCCFWGVRMAFLWGGGVNFFGEVGWSVFLSLLGWGLAGVLPLGFLTGGCGCGRFCGEVVG